MSDGKNSCQDDFEAAAPRETDFARPGKRRKIRASQRNTKSKKLALKFGVKVKLSQATYEALSRIAQQQEKKVEQLVRDLCVIYLDKVERDVEATGNPNIARVLGRGW